VSGNKPKSRSTKKPAKESNQLQAKSEQPTNDELQKALIIDFISEGALKVLDNVTDLLKDSKALATIAEYASQGASVETIEGALGIASGQMKQWLRIGRDEKDGPYRALFLYYSKLNAGTRLMAESGLLSRNPEKWLATVELQNVLRSEEPTTPRTLEGTTRSESQPTFGPHYIDTEDLT
jgi:transposase-like protein